MWTFGSRGAGNQHCKPSARRHILPRSGAMKCRFPVGEFSRTPSKNPMKEKVFFSPYLTSLLSCSCFSILQPLGDQSPQLVRCIENWQRKERSQPYLILHYRQSRWGWGEGNNKMLWNMRVQSNRCLTHAERIKNWWLELLMGEVGAMPSMGTEGNSTICDKNAWHSRCPSGELGWHFL